MINLSEIKKGMYLSNNGKDIINLYDSKDGTGDILLSIKPGQIIGKVVDFSNGPIGSVVLFASDKINDASGALTRFNNYFFNWVPGVTFEAASANFSDIQANISEENIQKQNVAMGMAAANGVNITNSIKSAAEGAGDIISDAGGKLIPWNLVWGAGAVYVVINWNKFFKPVNIKK